MKQLVWIVKAESTIRRKQRVYIICESSRAGSNPASPVK